jgi:tRNA(adenine34) deaminase
MHARAHGGAAATAARDEHFMRRALGLARAAARRGEVPVGAVVVLGDRAVAGAGNGTIGRRDPTAHAEVLALRRAARKTRNHRLTGATLYVTLEPCLMCCGAAVHARVGRLVFGATDTRVGAISSQFDRGGPAGLNHRFAVAGGVGAAASAGMLRGFFRARRGARPK